MTETPENHTPDGDPSPTPPTPPTPEQPSPRRLTRSSHDRMIGGVAGGLGRYFGIDPVLVRVGFVVVTLFWGVGALAYLALLLVVPTEPGEGPPARSSWTALALGAAVVVLAVAAVFGSGWFFIGPGVIALALLVALGVLIWRSAEGGGDARRVFGRALIVAGALVLAAVAGTAAAIGAAFGGGAILAGVVIALGAALVVAAFFGGARWLIAPALVLALPVAVVAAADLEIDGPVGDRYHRPAALADVRDRYELGAGDLTLDLRQVDFPPGRTNNVALDIGAGHALVLVPSDVCVSSDVEIGAGWAEVLDSGGEGGFDVEFDSPKTPDAGAARLHLRADIGLGALEVDDGFGFGRFEKRRRGRGRFFDDEPGDVSNLACTTAGA